MVDHRGKMDFIFFSGINLFEIEELLHFGINLYKN